MTYADNCADRLVAISRCAPRVHCITNAVAMTYTANMLLAVGAIPTLSMAVGEITDFVTGASSLSINIGTLDAQRRIAIEQAINVAMEQGKPWVLDPVLVNCSTARYRYAEGLLRYKPSVIRGNATEIAVLAGLETDEAPRALARSAGSIVVQTGPSDIVTSGRHTLAVANGHPIMTRVTAMGCAASALIGAFLAVENDPLAAAAQAMLALCVAGEIAAESASGPGTLQVRILDELYRLDGATLAQRSRISELTQQEDK